MRDDDSPSGQAVDTPASILHRFDTERMGPWRGRILLGLGVVLVIAAGITTGYFLVPEGVTSSTGGETKKEQLKEKPKTAAEDIAFRDCAEGKLERLADTEKKNVGTHKLIRGDESQTAYLTSSVADLDAFRGKDVTVWGETHTSQEVGWFMDVGRVAEGKGKCDHL
ncbi:MAG: hypothetical protein Q8R11_03280 [bacterium]|nr:hypothetical protein [bacterium]